MEYLKIIQELIGEEKKALSRNERNEYVGPCFAESKPDRNAIIEIFRSILIHSGLSSWKEDKGRPASFTTTCGAQVYIPIAATNLKPFCISLGNLDTVYASYLSQRLIGRETWHLLIERTHRKELLRKKTSNTQEKTISSSMSKKSIYKAAVEKWGIELQFIMVIQEFAELIKAITNVFRRRGRVDDLLEELADAEIMIEQMRYLYREHDKRFSQIKQAKLDRLRALIGEKE